MQIVLVPWHLTAKLNLMKNTVRCPWQTDNIVLLLHVRKDWIHGQMGFTQKVELNTLTIPIHRQDLLLQPWPSDSVLTLPLCALAAGSS